MHVLVKEFAIQEFGPIVEKMSEEKWNSFRTTLYSIIFSHRHKKDDEFLNGVDFTLIRDVLYSYSTESRVMLMSDPFFSLAVINFLKNGKEEFVKDKVKNKPKLYSDEMYSELESLEEEANVWVSAFKFDE